MNKIKIISLVLVVSAIFIFLIMKLPLLENDSRLYTAQVSESVKEAKHNRVFVTEYDFYPETIVVKGKEYKIVEIWSEQNWLYEDKRNEGKSFWNPTYTKTKTEDLTITKDEGVQIVFSFSPFLSNGELNVSDKDTINLETKYHSNGFTSSNLNINLEERDMKKDTLQIYLFTYNKWGNEFLTELKLFKK
ncbi:hypothetical protein O2K51_10880 [Apibacter raozihei]|uniref:hypothetical protein n=1 Tax=Apibacter raozihei TaxID=2500547 RepID=UPI000FE2F107|nr:hypothetical protein [Apibacter raozihei]